MTLHDLETESESGGPHGPSRRASVAFRVNGGNARITYPGTITNNSSSARAVSITGWAGDDAGDHLLLSGAIDAGDPDAEVPAYTDATDGAPPSRQRPTGPPRLTTRPS